MYTGFRWHVRACAIRASSLRTFYSPELIAPVVVAIESVQPAQDQQWHEEIVLTLIPNPKLNEAQKALVEKTSACLMAIGTDMPAKTGIHQGVWEMMRSCHCGFCIEA